MSGYFEDSDLCQQQAEQDPPPPRVVQLELTADCNLHCVFCPLQSESRDRAPGHRRIELSELQTTLGPLLAGAYEVELTGFGEIFCHPQLIEILRYLKTLALTVNATSNGMMWRDDLLEMVVSENLIDLICVSLDAGSAGTYNRLRAGGDFERVVANLTRLNELKNNCGQAKPVLHLSFISLVDNLPELPEAIRLAKRVGAGCVIVQGLCENERTRGRSSANSPDEGQVFTEAVELAKREGMPLEFWYQSNNQLAEDSTVRRVQVTAPPGSPAQVKECPYPWERLFVKSNLDVQVCATLWEQLILGNLRRQSLQEIWLGEPYRQVRRRLAGTNPPPECRTCPTKSWRPARRMSELSEKLNFGERFSYQLGQGFYEAEVLPDGTRFRWTTGHATFFLPNTGRPFLDFDFYTHPRMPTSLISVLVNGELVDRLRHDHVYDVPLRFVLPPSDAPAFQIELIFDRPFTPAEVQDSDSRRLLGAMAVRAMLAGNARQISSRLNVGDNDEQHLGRGFYPVEPSATKPMRWFGDRGIFAIGHGWGDHVEIELWTLGKPHGQRVTVSVDGEVKTVAALPGQAGRVFVRAPLGGRRPWHVVALDAESLWVPGGKDIRQLGAMFAGARVVRGARPPWWRRW